MKFIKVLLLSALFVISKQGEVFSQTAPTAYQPSSVTSTSFVAKWSGMSGTTAYLLDVSTNVSFSSGFLLNGAMIQSTSTSVSTGGFGTYYYRVRAVYSTGPSGYSNVMTVTANPPPFPTAKAASGITNIGLTVNWATMAGATSYQLDISKVSDFSTLVSSFVNLTGTSKSLTGLTSGTLYYYRVRAVNSIGASLNSNVINVTTTGPPQPPTNIIISGITSTSFIISWDVVGSASSYRLDVSTTNTFQTLIYSNVPVMTTSYTVYGLASNTPYFCQLRSVSTGGTSINTPFAIGVTLLPNPPDGLKITGITSNSFSLAWNSVSGASYKIDVSTSPDFSSFLTNYNDRPVSTNSITVSNLNFKTKYYCRFRTVIGNAVSPNSIVLRAADLDYNYRKSIDVQMSGKKTMATTENATVTEGITNLAFYDGLGRPSQAIAKQSSPNQSDIVQPKVYDQLGREAVKYLPFVWGNDGWFKPDFKLKADLNYTGSPQYQFYQTASKVSTDTKPFAEAHFYNDPLSRVMKQGAPGVAWQPDATDSYTNSTDRTVKEAYGSNLQNEVKFWIYVPQTSTTPIYLTSTTYYTANQLFVTRTKDEAMNEVLEYKNKEGKVILKKVQVSSITWAETYYIYDQKGNLVVVLPPEGVKAFSN